MHRYQTIGIDCDDVLSQTINAILETPFFQEKQIKKSNITSYNLYEIPKLWLAKEATFHLFRDFINSDAYRKMPAVPGAREKLTERKKSGIKLIVVTGRSEGLRARTQERLERYFPGIFEEIIFGQELTPQERKKSEICKSAGIELMIEDRLPIVQELANAGITSFLLDNPRNQLSGEETENPQVHRVQHWAEISR